jgi:hypothetical protein
MGRPVLLVSTTREAWRHTPAAAWRVQVQFGTSNRSRGGRWGRTAASDFSRSRSETRATSSAALSVRVSPVRHLHDEHEELPIQDPVPHAVVPAPNPTAVLAPARRLYSLWPRVNGELPAGVGHGSPGPGVSSFFNSRRAAGSMVMRYDTGLPQFGSPSRPPPAAPRHPVVFVDVVRSARRAHPFLGGVSLGKGWDACHRGQGVVVLEHRDHVQLELFTSREPMRDGQRSVEASLPLGGSVRMRRPSVGALDRDFSRQPARLPT